jgi:uncharacterized repeat protein (TIGR01451 family)
MRVWVFLGWICCATQVWASTPSVMQGLQPNLGQFDARVAFAGRQDGVELFVTREGELVHRLQAADGQAWVLVERLQTDAALQPVAVEQLESVITVLHSEDSASAKIASRVVLGEPWRGIRADLQVADGGFEKRFHLAPGVSPQAIRIQLDGAEALAVSADGRLLLGTGLGEVEMSAPIAWQHIKGRQVPIEVAYAITAERSYGFRLGAHDPRHGVVIDPIVRSTFAGAGGDESVATVVAVDDAVYLAGTTSSFNFPGTAGGAQPNLIITSSSSSGFNAFVARFSPDLRTLYQATYFGRFGAMTNTTGQNGTVTLRDIAVDATSVYLSGTTPGTGTHVPTTAGAAQTVSPGLQDGFVARLSRDLTQLQAATYLGGASDDQLWPIDVNENGVYVAGQGASTTLPGLAAGAFNAAPAPAGSGAAFVSRLSHDLSTVLATSWVSTGGWDMDSYALTLGDDGSVYVAGDGTRALFNTAGAFQPNRASTGITSDGFVARLSADLATLHRSTWLGGSGAERIDAIKVHEGALYLAGTTDGASFPVAPDGALTTWRSGHGFVFALNPDLSSRVGGTFYGGSNGGVSVGGLAAHDGSIYVGGTTSSTTLPATAGGAEPTNANQGVCGFGVRLNAALTTFRQASYVACNASNSVQVFGLGFANDLLYFGGRTMSNTLPGVADGAQTANGGQHDGFLILGTADLGPPRPVADLAIAKTASPRRIAGRWIRYQITVDNLGPETVANARILDPLPPELAAAGWSCLGSNGALCPGPGAAGGIDVLATLPVGGRLVFDLCARASGAPALVVNTAQVIASENTLDPVSDNNSASAVTDDPNLFADGFEGFDLPPWCPVEP